MSKFRFEDDPYIKDELEDLNRDLFRKVIKALKKLEKRLSWAIENRRKNCKPHISHLTKTKDGTNIWYVQAPERGDNIFRVFFYRVRSKNGDFPKYLYAYQKKQQKIPNYRKKTIVNRYWQRKGED